MRSAPSEPVHERRLDLDEVVRQGRQTGHPDAPSVSAAGQLAGVRVAGLTDGQLGADAQQLGGQQASRRSADIPASVASARPARREPVDRLLSSRLTPSTDRELEHDPGRPSRQLDPIDPTAVPAVDAAPAGGRPARTAEPRPDSARRSVPPATRSWRSSSPHIDLAKAEAARSRRGRRVAALGALAIALVIFAVFLFVIGLSLDREWVLGSMGWGVVHGVELFLAVAMRPSSSRSASLPRGSSGFGRRIVVGLVIGVALALNLPNQAMPPSATPRRCRCDPGIRPLVVGLLIGGFIGLIAGLFARVPA